MQNVGPAIAALATLLLAGQATAACPAANQYNFLFNSQPQTSLSYTGSYTYTATSTALGNQTFTVSFLANGQSSNTAGGVAMPAINALINDDNASRFLVVGGIFSARTADISTNTRVVVTTFTFPTAVRDVTVTASDIDFTSNQFRDWFMAVGRNGANSYVPGIVTPYGQANNTGPYTNGSSALTLGPVSTPVTVTASQAVGTGSSPNTDTTGNVTISFPQPVTSIELRYGNYPYTSGENTTGQQAIGFKGVSWCPMPVLSVTKTSAPWSDPQNGTTNPKLVPGADLIYTLTVANSNTSPIDLSTAVLSDVLPANVTFYNGDIDDGGPLTTNFSFNAGSSGLTFGAGNLTYSNNSGSTYTYTPAAGYDANVNALRFAPQGTMAANTSFSIQFRARIK
jgi:uncharacterized repeat protein (TIGR01451 family)